MTKQNNKQTQTFIFNVEIMIQDSHHADALEKLLKGLNSNGWEDYRITSGIQLGELIQQRLAESPVVSNIPIAHKSAEPAQSEQTKPATTQSAEADSGKSQSSPSQSATSDSGQSAPEAKVSASDGFEPIRNFMKSNSLIRLIVNRGLGIKLNIPCRIINMDEKASLITVYHVDEKQVYTFRMNEIEDFIPG